MLDAIKRALGYFDSNGLRFTTAHLAAVDHKKLLDKPVQIQAQYVDKICFEKVKNGKDIDQLQSLKDLARDRFVTRDFPNTTTVGGLAFISLYSNHLQMKRLAFEILQNYKRAINGN